MSQSGREGDEQGGAPGADTIKELFGGEPTLILMDELSVYLRKLKGREREAAGAMRRNSSMPSTSRCLAPYGSCVGRAVLFHTLAVNEGPKGATPEELRYAIQQRYRHVLYPSRNRVDGADVDLAHTAIDVQTASKQPSPGQKQVVEVLRANDRLRLPEDEPDSPTQIRDRTPLEKGTITTGSLYAEFRRGPALPILVGDDVFVKAIRRGIELGEYVYQSGELTCGKGDPWASIHIDEQSFVHTAQYAKDNFIWPKVAKVSEPTGPTAGVTTGAGGSTTRGQGTPAGRAGAGAGVFGSGTAGGTGMGSHSRQDSFRGPENSGVHCQS